jgi:predicted  nucleic acid-binding Zn-ribbon protein
VPTAPAADQVRLLAVQELDLRLQQAQHRRDTLPVLATIAALEGEAGELGNRIVALSTDAGDIRREVTKAEDDVQNVRARADRDRAKLDSGNGSAKDLQALQSEVVALAKRQGDLEDVELEAMERLEAADEVLAVAKARAREIEAALAVAATERDASFATIDTEIAGLAAERAAAAAGIDAGLATLYERLRASHGGVGAAVLKGNQCQGCHMNVNPGDLATMQAASADEICRCEECDRILVRAA